MRVLSVVEGASIPPAQSTSLRNCLIRPFFLGPRQIMAASVDGSRNSTDMHERLSVTNAGVHPEDDAWTYWFRRPRIVGIDGPHTSMSSTAVCASGSLAQAHASCDVKVLFPTPPLPLIIKILEPMHCMRSRITGRSGSGPLGAVWQ